jgi:hypothetical protein
MKPSSCDSRSQLRSQLAAVKQRELGGLSIWEQPVHAIPSAATPDSAIPIEREILELLARPTDPRETHRVGNDRKERELFALLDTLSAVEALSLTRRLACARKDDALVVAFVERLSPDRRARVISFVADTRRRIAARRSR